VEAIEGGEGEPAVPAYAGGRMPLTTNLGRPRAQHDSRFFDVGRIPRTGAGMAGAAKEGFAAARAGTIWLVETFPRGDRFFLVAYCFEGRNAHQTLGLLLTRRMQRFGMQPLGFVATDYVLATWSANEPTDVARLFEQGHAGATT